MLRAHIAICLHVRQHYDNESAFDPVGSRCPVEHCLTTQINQMDWQREEEMQWPRGSGYSR